MNKIDICAGLAQWEDIDNIIVMPSAEPCENNVDDIKVTSDSDFIYMLIECTENISFFVDSKVSKKRQMAGDRGRTVC